MRTVVAILCASLLSACTLLAAPHTQPDGRSARALFAAQIRAPAVHAPVSDALDGRAAVRAQTAYEKSFGERQAAPASVAETAK